MTLKERLGELTETRKAVRVVEEAKLKKEHEAREADIDKKAKALSEDLGVSVDTARKAIKAQKVGELRAVRREKLKKKMVKAGKTIQKYGEEVEKARNKSGGSSFLDIDEMLSYPKKKKTKKKTKTKKKIKGGAKPEGKKEIRILID